MSTKTSDKDFIATWRACNGRAIDVARVLGTNVRGVYSRRASIENRLSIRLPSEGANGTVGRGDAGTAGNQYLKRLTIDGHSGTIVVFSDAHYWPGKPTLAHRALVEVVKELKPKIVIGNGDLFDGARISRFPRNGWEEVPRVSEELEAATERLAEVRHAYSRARFIRTMGNHDIRFDRYISENASELEGIKGTRLSDHLPAWEECMSVFVNKNTMIKHRFNGGIHAGYNNVLKAGTSMVTGHTHILEVRPWGDYTGRRYGVQTGAIADTNGEQFSYTEDNPTPWCSGFAVVPFDHNGRILSPQLCEVVDGVAYFNGQKVVSGK